MQSICHMLFFHNILTAHRDALNPYTQVCAHSRDSELELVQLGGLPSTAHTLRKTEPGPLSVGAGIPMLMLPQKASPFPGTPLSHSHLAPSAGDNGFGLFFLCPHPHPTLTLYIILFQHTLQL